MNLSRLRRVLYLSARDLRTHKVRSALLVAMASLGLLVFLATNSLAVASQNELDAAIGDQLGAQGVYEVRVPANLGVSSGELSQTVESAADQQWPTESFSTLWFGMTGTNCEPEPIDDTAVFTTSTDTEDYADGTEEFPDGTEMGEYIEYEDYGPYSGPQEIIGVVSAGNLDRFVPARSVAADRIDAVRTLDPVQPESCLFNLPVAVAEPTLTQAVFKTNYWGDQPPLVLPPTEVPAAIAAFGWPDQMSIYLHPDTTEVVNGQLEELIVDTLQPLAARTGADFDPETIVVYRLDEDGELLRDAGRGIDLALRGVGWAVLLLGGFGLLVAQMMNAQSRIWFFGLSRVWGASAADLAAIAIFEVTLLVLSALTIVLTTALAVSPIVDSWLTSTFGSSVPLLPRQSFGGLLLATLVLAVVGALLPAYRAAKADPLEALE